MPIHCARNIAPIHAHLPTDWPAKMVATIAWLGVEDITVATVAWLGVGDITAATIAIIRVATVAINAIDDVAGVKGWQ